MLDLSMLKEPVVTGLSSDAAGKLTATFSDKSTKVISVLQPPVKTDANTADWTLHPDVFCLGATVVREGDTLALEILREGGKAGSLTVDIRGDGCAVNGGTATRLSTDRAFVLVTVSDEGTFPKLEVTATGLGKVRRATLLVPKAVSNG
jgi:hypothetical protein